MADIIKELEKYLEEEDLVILVDIPGANPMTEMLCGSEALSNTSKSVVILSTVNCSTKPRGHIYRVLTETEMRTLLEIYQSYESSDKLILLTDSRNYGSTWNYVGNGLLSSEEMFQAMLA